MPPSQGGWQDRVAFRDSLAAGPPEEEQSAEQPSGAGSPVGIPPLFEAYSRPPTTTGHYDELQHSHQNLGRDWAIIP